MKLMQNIPKREVCANCRKTYRREDKYCRYCGAPLGKPEYIEERFACIYGPEPMRRTHTCTKCGYSWKTVLMIDEESWCPQCGGPAPCAAEEKCWE